MINKILKLLENIIFNFHGILLSISKIKVWFPAFNILKKYFSLTNGLL